MSAVVGYVPTREGETALEHAVREARSRGVRLVVVNTSRGGLVDTAALVRALEEGPLCAAGLDVYEDEPRVPPELTRLEHVVLAPHIGSATTEARNGMARLAAENVIAK